MTAKTSLSNPTHLNEHHRGDIITNLVTDILQHIKLITDTTTEAGYMV